MRPFFKPLTGQSPSMTKTTERKAARPCPIPTAQPITIKVKIPAKAVPLFRAFCELYGVSREKLAVEAVLRFITSETAVGQFDAVQNVLSSKLATALPKH